VPGAYGKTPWTLSRDRQDISEDLWIDVFIPDTALTQGVLTELYATNFTLRCTSNTTRGYFEVNNNLNGNNPGPLLETWPSQEELAEDYNDFLNFQGGDVIPSTMWVPLYLYINL
jgi:hypothetical protein